MDILTVTEGFVYGELSPLASGQISSDAYEQSARTMLNMIPDVRGPAKSRAGMKYKISIDASVCKMFELQVSPTESYVCALTPQEITIIPSIAVHLSRNVLINGEFTEGEVGWDPETIGAATYEFGKDHVSVYPGVEAGETVLLQQAFTVPDTSIGYDLIIKGLFRGPSVNEAINLMVGTTPGASDVYSVDLYNNYTYHKVSINASGQPTPLYLTIVAKDWSGADIDDTESYIKSIRLERNVPVSQQATINMASPFLAEQIKDIQAIRKPNSTALVLLHKDVPPQELLLETGTWSLTEIVFTDMPADWVPGSFPTVAAFFQGRAVWTGFTAFPERFIFSASADYYNLTQGTEADESFTFDLDRAGKIRWVIGTKSLLLGTENAEFIIMPTDADGVIKPGAIQVELQSTYGAGEVTPVLVGTETAFVSADARSVYAMSYFWEDDGWVAESLSQGSEHITYPAITEIDIAINPEPTLWCTLGDGALAACTYHYKKGGTAVRAKRITGWHKHRFKWPAESVAVIQEFGHSIPWVALKVLVNDEYKIHIGPLDVNDPDYMDDSLRIAANDPFTYVTGLDHLEGQEVDVLSDFATHAKLTVENGAITLDEPTQEVVVGLSYLAKLVTQPMALATKTGTLRYGLGRWTEMFVYIYESAFPLLDGMRAAEHGAQTRMGYHQEPYTGYTNSCQVGWERDSVMTIEQDLPFPLTILHIAGKVNKS